MQECPYGEKCYRKNPIHFGEYSHAHCNVSILYLMYSIINCVISLVSGCNLCQRLQWG